MYTGDPERLVIPATLVTSVVLLLLPGDVESNGLLWPP
jgi:hypothetical protein